MRSRFDEQLDQLNKELISMGALCEEAIGRSVRALRDGDPALAATAIPLDAETDRMERVIEDRCLRLLLQQQPVARDLRQITAAMKMITDLERIGDQAADIASIVQYLNGRSVKPCMPLIPMAEAAMRMVTGSVDAYVKRDLEAARLVIEQDDAVDEYFERVKDYLIDIIANSPEEGEYALDLLMIAKYLERIGDQAADIASIVQYLNGRSVKPCMPLIPMAEAAMRMVTGSVDAYVKRDLEAARLVIEQDDAVDEYFERVKDYLIDIMAINELLLELDLPLLGS